MERTYFTLIDQIKKKGWNHVKFSLENYDVSKTDLTGEMQQQFFITWARENQPHDWLHYYASNKDNTAEKEAE